MQRVIAIAVIVGVSVEAERFCNLLDSDEGIVSILYYVNSFNNGVGFVVDILVEGIEELFCQFQCVVLLYRVFKCLHLFEYFGERAEVGESARVGTLLEIEFVNLFNKVLEQIFIGVCNLCIVDVPLSRTGVVVFGKGGV